MSLPTPNLDDRTFDQLVLEARARIAQTSPGWTDLSPHDPGMVLVETFAYLTESLLYRLNRVPEKVYVEFLRLIGVKLQPPGAAAVRLTFTLERPAERAVEIPRGTRITTSRAGAGATPIVFATTQAARIEPGATEATALALHAEVVEAELLGQATGLPGLTLSLKRPPVIAPSGDELDLVLGVEAAPGELDDRAPARRHGEKAFRVWREVESFTHPGPDPYVYVADRMMGTVTFAPAAQLLSESGALDPVPRALAAVPPAGREIRAWYRRGGGVEGNVAAGTLEVLKDQIPGVKVTNRGPATGGHAAETLENALVRGPEEIHSLRRAVTARDFETIALRSSTGTARARALTQAQLWVHAPPGTVEVLLVPDLPPAVRGGSDEGVTAANLHLHQTEEARARIQAELDERRPLGTACVVTWARYKTVSVKARLVAHRAEDVAAVRARVTERLYRTINPLPTALNPSGWRFGQALRPSNVYDALLSEPGVNYVDQVKLRVDDVPEQVTALEVDRFQPRTWYAGGGELLFRSGNDGEGWEPAGHFPGEAVHVVEANPQRPGLVAVATLLPGGGDQARLHVSSDCGETWDAATQTLATIEDMAWILREGVPILLLATRVGLFELAMQPGAKPLQVVVEPQDQDLGFWAVAASTDFRGASSVAVAAMESGGVYLSASGGQGGTFRPIGLKGKDVRLLEAAHDGPRTFLWAGLAAASGADPGKGCLSYELLGSAEPPAGWRAFDKNWDGGSCLSLATAGATLYAGTHRAGVLWLDSSREGASWRRLELSSGLPLRETERLFQPVPALAAAPNRPLVLAAGAGGVFRTTDGQRYVPSAQREFSDTKVTLPPTWLFCSGQHEIEVVHDDAAQGD